MSRIGKQPIEITDGVNVQQQGREITIKGPKGELKRTVRPEIKIEIKDNQILVSPLITSKQSRAYWGLERALLQNMIVGVTQGFKKELEIQGVGYRASITGDKLILEVGYSHKVKKIIPKDLEVSVKAKIITVVGIDKNKVGQFAAEVKRVKKPDAYKGKGIRYLGENIKLKPGKKAATA